MKPTIALLMFALTSVAATAGAQTWPDLSSPPAVEREGTNDVAVIVAVEDYAFLPDVPGATKNAADWEAFLSDGLGVGTVLMLTNQQAVREEIQAFAQKAANEVGDGGTLWFVFIGHGGPAKSGDDGLLIGADGQQNAKSMAARGLPQKELLAALGTGKQARTVVLIDACFSGRDSSGGALAKGTMPVLPVDVAPAVPQSAVVMTAAKSDEFAGNLPGADRPAFSYFVLGGLRGWADDGDGEVTASEAVTFARRQLLGISGRQQTPQITGSDGLVLARGGMEPAPNIDPNVDRPSGIIANKTTPEGPPPDGKPDSKFFANAHVGPLLNAGNALGWAVIAGVGGKLGELRLGAVLGVGNPANPGRPTSGELVTDRSNTIPVDASTGNGTGQLGAIVGGSVGYGFRHETRKRDDVLWVDGVITLVAGQVCEEYSFNTSKNKIVCDTTRSSLAPLFGARLGGKLGLVSASILAGYRAWGDGDLMVLVGAGIALDD